MPAEADLFSSEIFVSSRNLKAVIFNLGIILHKVFDVIQVLVYTIDAIGSGF